MIILTAKTRHGKNRIAQFGNEWRMTDHTEHRMLLENKDGTDKRWVDFDNDENFEWSLSESVTGTEMEANFRNIVDRIFVANNHLKKEKASGKIVMPAGKPGSKERIEQYREKLATTGNVFGG